MAIDWTEVITGELRTTLNVSLASTFVEPGERYYLAGLYGVGIRTVDRWFADTNAQRRPCIVQETEGMRLVNMDESRRTEYLRRRCFLPMLLCVGAIEREFDLTGQEEGVDYELRERLFPEASLAMAINSADVMVRGLIDTFIEFYWYRIELAYLENTAAPWLLTVRYIRPLIYKESEKAQWGGEQAKQEAGNEDVEKLEYDEYDELSAGPEGAWVYEP